MDGDKTTIFHDVDGSVSEYPGVFLVKEDNWLLRHPDCIDVPDWRAAICSGRYAQVGQWVSNSFTQWSSQISHDKHKSAFCYIWHWLITCVYNNQYVYNMCESVKGEISPADISLCYWLIVLALNWMFFSVCRLIICMMWLSGNLAMLELLNKKRFILLFVHLLGNVHV